MTIKDFKVELTDSTDNSIQYSIEKIQKLES